MDLESTPRPPSRDDALIHAQEALSAARSAVESMVDGSDRVYALDQIAARWLQVADRLEPNGPAKGLHTPSGGQSPSGQYLRVGQAVSGPQTGAQGRTGKGEPRTLNFGPDMPVVHLWQGVAYAVGSLWTDTRHQPWMVVDGYQLTGEPWLEPRGPNENSGRWSVGRVIDAFGNLVRIWSGPGVYAFGDERYPLGTVWTDRDGDRWRVAGPDERGELRMVDESTKDRELMPGYEEGETLYCATLDDVLNRWGPITRAEDDAIHLL